MTDELLTQNEFDALELSAKLVNTLREIIGDSQLGQLDMTEMVFHIHSVQNAILAQAAGRAYPDKFRLMGYTAR